MTVTIFGEFTVETDGVSTRWAFGDDGHVYRYDGFRPADATSFVDRPAWTPGWLSAFVEAERAYLAANPAAKDVGAFVGPGTTATPSASSEQVLATAGAALERVIAAASALSADDAALHRFIDRLADPETPLRPGPAAAMIRAVQINLTRAAAGLPAAAQDRLRRVIDSPRLSEALLEFAGRERREAYQARAPINRPKRVLSIQEPLDWGLS